ncbi:MAG TPA: hypothetical protein VLM91_10850 [Candidatus Methylomirabilis sp.]|nr:hypothetical protein [Candidatus Methylomirabilis sp.]
MPMWGGYWGIPWGGFGWIFPLIGLVFMLAMAFMCFRMMGGKMGGCMSSHSGQGSGEVEELRKEIRDLREEIRKIHGQA